MRAQSDAKRVVGVARRLWVALLMAQVLMLSVCLGGRLMMPSATWVPGWPMNVMVPLLVFGMLVSGYIGRNEAYKAHWQGDAITGRGYLQGSIVLWSLLCLAGATLGVMLLITGAVAWHAALAVGVLVLFWLSFPTGRPMTPRGPRIERGE